MTVPRLKRYRSGYKRPSLTYRATDYDLQRQTDSYLVWLAEGRGWLADKVKCRHCDGRGDHHGYHRKKRQICHYCGGEGKVTPDKPVPDLDRARAHCYEQQEQLEGRAVAATDAIRERLHAAGFRPILSRYYGGAIRLPQTLADYEAQLAERAKAGQAFEAASAAHDAETARIEAIWQAGGTAFEDLPARPNYSVVEQARQDYWRHGEPDRQRWYRPGEKQFIYVGTRPDRRSKDKIEPAYSIIVAAGMAPGESELDLMVAEAIAALAETSLLTAA